MERIPPSLAGERAVVRVRLCSGQLPGLGQPARFSPQEVGSALAIHGYVIHITDPKPVESLPFFRDALTECFDPGTLRYIFMLGPEREIEAFVQEHQRV